MKVMQLSESGQGLIPIQAEVPAPKPGRGQVLVRVHAVGVTKTELGWKPTTHNRQGGPRAHAVPGHEFSGVIAELGKGVADLAVGQAIYGMNDWYDDGAVAELCLTVPESIAPKPATLGHVEAAAVPIGALTAWQGLFDRARLQKGERVLAHGGAGSVGAFVVQLAHRHGAHVIATASAKNLARVRELGADEVIDHDRQRFDELVRQVDVVFDTVGGETLERSWKLLAPAGRMISVAASGEETPDARQRASFFIVEPNRRQLASVAALLDARSLQALVNAVVPFAAAASAYAGTVADARGYGKIVIEVAR